MLILHKYILIGISQTQLAIQFISFQIFRGRKLKFYRLGLEWEFWIERLELCPPVTQGHFSLFHFPLILNIPPHSIPLSSHSNIASHSIPYSTHFSSFYPSSFSFYTFLLILSLLSLYTFLLILSLFPLSLHDPPHSIPPPSHSEVVFIPTLSAERI